MRLAKPLNFSDAQSVASAVSDNALDLGLNGDDLSRRINVFAKIDGGSVAGGTSIQALLQTSEDNSTFNTLVTYPARTLAQIQADSFIVPLQPLPAGSKRYLRMSYTVSGTFTGDGKILAGLTESLDTGL